MAGPVLTAVMGVLGAGVGLLILRWLATRGYRWDDEQDVPRRAQWWVVPMTTVAFGAVGWRLSGAPLMVIITYAAAAAMFVVLTAIDVDVHRLPNKILLPAYPVFAVLLALCSLAIGDFGAWVTAVVTGGVLWVVYFALAFFSPGGEGIGFGDVKLAGIIGGLVGWLAWPLAIFATFLAFLIGGLIGIALLAARRAGLKSNIAFGPPMMLGAMLAVLLPASTFGMLIGG